PYKVISRILIMELKVLKSSKEEIEVQLENLTLVELLRVYLNKDSGVSFAAWRRDHPSEKPILKVTTKGKTAKKAVSDAVTAITKDLDNLEDDFKKMK
ncbi:MAG: RpoL/Rpb11 RNA polymerase subunit family protein, partial [Nanoarchaeota archaeon]